MPPHTHTHQCPTRVPALCPRGGHVERRACLGRGRPWGGPCPPPSVHHVTTRLTLETDTNVGCPPPPKKIPLVGPPLLSVPQGEMGGHQEALAGSHLPPQVGKGWRGRGRGWGERGKAPGPPPQKKNNRCGLRVVKSGWNFSKSAAWPPVRRSSPAASPSPPCGPAPTPPAPAAAPSPSLGTRSPFAGTP